MRSFLKIALPTALFIVLSFCSGRQACAQGNLAWSINVESKTANLSTNDFLKTNDFPVKYIRITKYERNEQLRDDGGVILSTKHEIAPLYINDDGTLGNSNLVFFPENYVAKTLENDNFTVIKPSNASLSLVNAEVRQINLEESAEQRFISSLRLPSIIKDGKPFDIGVVTTSHGTYFFDITNQTNLRPFGFLIVPVNGMTVASNSQIIAGEAQNLITRHIFKNGKNQQFCTQDNKYALMVMDFNANIKYEGEFGKNRYGDLHLLPNGKALIFNKEKRGEKTKIQILNLDTKAVYSLDIVEEGPRYYSDDGRRMAVIKNPEGGGSINYYNIEDPYNPKLLWKYQSNEIIITASVNEDGSLIAAQTQTGKPGTSVANRVFVLNESMSEIAEPVTGAANLSIPGLQWENGYLFVGVQRHPIPPGVHTRNTDIVNVYDFVE